MYFMVEAKRNQAFFLKHAKIPQCIRGFVSSLLKQFIVLKVSASKTQPIVILQ